MTGKKQRALLALLARGIYAVTQDGEVFSFRRGAKKPLAAKALSRGYPVVRVTLAPKKSCMVYVHHLVYLAHRGAYSEGLQINHMDGVKTNNSIGNLEVVTAAQNLRHAVETGLRTYTRKNV